MSQKSEKPDKADEGDVLEDQRGRKGWNQPLEDIKNQGGNPQGLAAAAQDVGGADIAAPDLSRVRGAGQTGQQEPGRNRSQQITEKGQSNCRKGHDEALLPSKRFLNPFFQLPSNGEGFKGRRKCFPSGFRFKDVAAEAAKIRGAKFPVVRRGVRGQNIDIGGLPAEFFRGAAFREPPAIINPHNPWVEGVTDMSSLLNGPPRCFNRDGISLIYSKGPRRFRVNDGDGVWMKAPKGGDLPSPGVPVGGCLPCCKDKGVFFGQLGGGEGFLRYFFPTEGYISAENRSREWRKIHR